MTSVSALSSSTQATVETGAASTITLLTEDAPQFFYVGHPPLPGVVVAIKAAYKVLEVLCNNLKTCSSHSKLIVDGLGNAMQHIRDSYAITSLGKAYLTIHELRHAK